MPGHAAMLLLRRMTSRPLPAAPAAIYLLVNACPSPTVICAVLDTIWPTREQYRRPCTPTAPSRRRAAMRRTGHAALDILDAPAKLLLQLFHYL